MDKRWERMEIKKENIMIDTLMSVATLINDKLNVLWDM